MKRSKRCWINRVLRSSWLAAKLLLLCCSVAQAEIYEYRDAQGKRVFVDRIYQVPQEYRDQLETRVEVKVTEAQIQESQRLQKIAQLERALRNIDRLLALQASPIHATNNQISVPVNVSRGNRSKQLNLLLDTGANRTVFHRDAVNPLGAVGQPVGQARVASGQSIDLYEMNLDKLSIGPFTIKPARVQVIDYQGDAGHQGLLGMDILSQVDYDLNVEKQELRWAPEQFKQLSEQRTQLEQQLAELRSPPPEMPAPVPSVPSADGTTE